MRSVRYFAHLLMLAIRPLAAPWCGVRKRTPRERQQELSRYRQQADEAIEALRLEFRLTTEFQRDRDD